MIIATGALVRRAIGVPVGLAAVVATVVALAPVQAQASTPVTRGGYVIEPSGLKSVTVQFRVPRLSCTASSTTHVSVGLFGHTSYEQQTTKWYAAVGVFCHHGTQRSFAVFGDYTPVQSKPVHAGDRIRITTVGVSPASTVADLTTGVRLTGGPAAPPGQTMVPSTEIAGRVTGSSPGRLRIALDHAAVNGKTLSTYPHHAVRQSDSTRTLVRAGALDPTGSGFTLDLR